MASEFLRMISEVNTPEKWGELTIPQQEDVVRRAIDTQLFSKEIKDGLFQFIMKHDLKDINFDLTTYVFQFITTGAFACRITTHREDASCLERLQAVHNALLRLDKKTAFGL